MFSKHYIINFIINQNQIVMKKLSFFLMAMLFSVMSFATEVTVTIGDYAAANGWVNSTAYDTLTMDEVVTVTANPTTGTYNNTGKYYDNGKNWRMYQNEAPAIVVTAAEGYQLTSVTFTYANKNTGVMLDADSAQVASGTAVALDKVASATFTVGNTDASVTNGNVQITAITVAYEAAEEEPVVTVPTNAELWEAFKPYYNTYYGLTRADQPIDKVSTFANAKMQEIMTDAVSEYKWLGDYVLGVAAGQGVNLPTDMAAANEGAWRWAVHAFFNATTGANGAAGTDFTEAGKPEKWGPYYLAAQTPVEPEIEWIEMPLEISNLTTMEMPVGDVTYLQLMGRNDQENADVMLFLNNYTGENKAYEVNVENSNMTFGGMELTVMDGSITKSVDPELGDVFAGTVHASVEEDSAVLYVAFDLKMYALPPIAIELEDVEIVVNEESAIAFFNATWEGSPLQVEVSGFEEVEFKEYEECWLSIGDDDNWVDAAAGPVAVIIADGVATLEGEFTSFATGKSYEVMLTGTLPVKEEPALKGVVKRAVQLGESVVVLTHEADGTAHIYNVVGEKISEVSQEGVIAVDTANAGDLLAISDIAVTEDGKLVAINYMQTQSGDDYVDAGYKRGETRVYLWDNLAGDPSTLFTSKMSSNWFRSKQGLTMAVKGTSDNMEIFTTGIHATKAWARTSSYRVIDGVYTEPDVNNNDYYHFYDVADAVALETTVGTQYELNASPLGAMNWILDAELINPVEIVEPDTNNVEISTCVALTQDLGKKFNGATILKEGEQVLMVAPYADADGKLAGVKVLDITDGLAADSVVATLDLDAPVEATAAATAVEVAAYDVNITLVADGYIYNLVYNLPKPERTETTVLNPFAYDLSSTLSEDLATLTINYTLNANADAVEVVILSGEEVVKTIPCKGINKGTYTVEVSTAGLPQDVDFTWSVNVKGTSVAAPTQNPTIYSFYHPSGLDIDNNPENPTFGMLLINEGMHSVKDIDSGYVSSNFGAGIFAFNPALEPMPNGDKPGYNGGVEFTTGRADGAGTAYSPRRIRISEDGRIFVTSLNTDGTYLWEVNPANMNEWTPVFQGTLNENKELVDADSNFVAAPNNGFDVKGAGENLQLMMYSVNLPGITGAAMSGFRCDEYNLGTATSWATAPSKNWVLGKYAINYTGTQVVYDNEGGIWIASYRGTANDANPGLVHINADGVEDAKLVWSNVRQAGIRFNNDFTKLIVAGNNGAAKKATIYAVSKDENGAPVLTEETVIDMAAIGNNINDLAFDYAGNLYACGNSAEKLIGWAMPYSGEVSTPAASKYAFTLESEPEYMVIEDEITNLVIDLESMAIIGGPSTMWQVDVYLGLAEDDNMDGQWSLSPESSVAIMGFDARFIDGYVYDIDVNAPAAKAVLHVEDSGFFYEIKLNMTSTPTEAIVVVVEDATVQIDTIPMFGDVVEYALKMTANWTDTTDNTTYPVLVEVPVYYPEATEPSEITCTVTIGGEGDDDPWLGFGEGTLTITTVDGVVTAKGIVVNPYTNVAFDVTVSGKLPEGPNTGLDNINLNAQPVKMIKDGMLIINKGGRKFNVQGAILK